MNGVHVLMRVVVTSETLIRSFGSPDNLNEEYLSLACDILALES